MSLNAYPLFLGLLTAIGSLIGGCLVLIPRRQEGWALKSFMALGAGFMLAAVFLELIPESFSHTPHAPEYILLGYLLVHFCEHSLLPHFHYGEETHPDELGHHHNVGYTVLLGLLLHSFFDGVSIGSAYVVKPSLGFLIFGAVILHKIPEGFTIGSVMKTTGHKPAGVIASSLAIGLASLMGVASTLFWFQGHLGICLGISAGVTLYVASSELIPLVNQERGVRWSFVVFAGVALFWLTEQVLFLSGLD